MMSSFSDQIAEFNIDFTELSDELFRITVIKLFSQIVLASPVDTGRFRANWFLTLNLPSTRVEVNSIKSASEVNRDIVNKVNASAGKRIFHLTNNLPYSEVLEFGGYGDSESESLKTIGGFSRQAPKGVLRITAKNFARIFNENADALGIS